MDEMTMFAELRPNDTLTDTELADLRAELFPDVEPNPELTPVRDGHPASEVYPLPVDRDTAAPRRWNRTVATAAAAIAVLGLGGLWVASNRDNGSTPAPAAQPSKATEPRAATTTVAAEPAATTSTPPPETTTPGAAGYTLLELVPPPAGFELSQARYTTDANGHGIARYTTPESSTELQIVIRARPLPVETLESLNRDTWDVDGHTVWSDGELDGCLPDVCSIGLQWDERTYVSLMWVEPHANDLAPGSTQDSLLALVPNLTESATDWQLLDDGDDPYAPVGAVPIVHGDVLVANANVIGGSAGKLTELLGAAGFGTVDPHNSTATNQPDTVVYARQGAECLGIQVAHSIGQATTEPMPDVLPVTDTTASGPDVVVELGNDIAEQLGAGDFTVDLGPAQQLVVVDATNDDSVIDSHVSELAASGITVTDVLPATQPWTGATLHPIGTTTPWTCGTASTIGIDGFDTWTPDIIDTDLPAGTGAVLVVGNLDTEGN